MKSAAYSEASRPPIPMKSATPEGVRRWATVNVSQGFDCVNLRSKFTHRGPLQVYFIRVVHYTVEDGICHGRVVKCLVPAGDRKLTGYQCCTKRRCSAVFTA